MLNQAALSVLPDSLPLDADLTEADLDRLQGKVAQAKALLNDPVALIDRARNLMDGRPVALLL